MHPLLYNIAIYWTMFHSSFIPRNDFAAAHISKDLRKLIRPSRAEWSVPLRPAVTLAPIRVHPPRDAPIKRPLLNARTLASFSLFVEGKMATLAAPARRAEPMRDSAGEKRARRRVANFSSIKLRVIHSGAESDSPYSPLSRRIPRRANF